MDAHAAQHAVAAAGGVQDLAWMVLASPLICAAGTAWLTRHSRGLTAGFNIAGVVLSFLLSLTLLGVVGGGERIGTAFHWLPIPGLDLSLGIHLDRLTTVMLMVVTGVASLVMVYSLGYMRDDPSFNRFFSTLSLFVFSMLGIVLADNLVMLFIFWELVGVSSYLLIGFWHTRPAAADAAKKAFLVNRLGDFGFLLGILVVWSALGTVNVAEVAARLAAEPTALGGLTSVAGVLIFLGAVGKSAQFPLHVWLPDAMEGPTPVSALIHAATMVAAGVYMLCRVAFLYALPAAWPDALACLAGISAGDIVAWTGGITALLAALIAVQQNDIKRILAYSTLSQLGYMVMAVGLGAAHGNPSAGMFHLVTHACFKALLFLGAGAVIHACHHEQDIWRMGGLWRRMPWTFWTFLLGTAALAGVPPFSGSYSKDEILVTALETSPVLFGLAVLVAALTTFYMARLVFVAFLGAPRSESAEHAHEVPGVMRWPLVVLAVPSVGLAWFPLGHFLAGAFGGGHGDHGHGADAAPVEIGFGPFFNRMLNGINEAIFAPFNHNLLAAMMGLFSVLIGLSAAWALYGRAQGDPFPARFGTLSRLMRNRFYFDELYQGLLVPIHDLVARLAGWADRWLVAGLAVRGLHGSVDLVGRAVRLVQTGSIQTYAFLFVAGAALVAWLVLS